MKKESLPEEYINMMEVLLGDEAKAFFASGEEAPVSSLRLNPLKTRDGEEVDITAFFPSAKESVSWEKFGRYYNDPDRPGKHPLHAAGAYYIQEASAMAPAALLMAEPLRENEKILDLCAAPGGKTTQIASYMKGRGLLVANEIISSRASILSENVERCGVRNCIVTNCSPQELAERFPSFFDRIMVDAPCSGEGMFRKNPEAVNEWSPENAELCAKRQDEILDCAAAMLSPGGILVYSTCTFNRMEDEGSAERFLEAHPGFSAVKTVDIKGKRSFSSPGVKAVTCEGNELSEVNITSDVVDIMPDADKMAPDVVNIIRRTASIIPNAADIVSDSVDIIPGMSNIMYNNRVLPHRERGEGQFFISFVKDGAFSSHQTGDLSVEDFDDGLHKSLSSEQLKLFAGWCETIGGLHNLKRKLLGEAGGKIRVFGKNLYFVPSHLPDMSGVKVLRWGLHLGCFEKKRFEPSHSLALILDGDDVLNHAALSYDEAVQYLKGMTVSALSDGFRQLCPGWTLMTFEGFSLGWGKTVGGIIKNHYPKGLRWN